MPAGHRGRRHSHRRARAGPRLPTAPRGCPHPRQGPGSAHRASLCAAACAAGRCRPTRSRSGPRGCPWWGQERCTKRGTARLPSTCLPNHALRGDQFAARGGAGGGASRGGGARCAPEARGAGPAGQGPGPDLRRVAAAPQPRSRRLDVGLVARHPRESPAPRSCGDAPVRSQPPTPPGSPTAGRRVSRTPQPAERLFSPRPRRTGSPDAPASRDKPGLAPTWGGGRGQEARDEMLATARANGRC